MQTILAIGHLTEIGRLEDCVRASTSEDDRRTDRIHVG
jgi:hypothetical protein